MAVKNVAQIEAAIGQSGTGKGIFVKSRLRKLKPKRILILDPQNEYEGFGEPVTSSKKLAEIVAAAGKSKPFAVRYLFPKICRKKQFDAVFDLACKLAYLAGDCVFLVEELSNFTTPSFAPEAWKRMSNSGRHEGVHVIGCSQFPAQIDKSFLSNCTMIHCGFLAQESHRKAVAVTMDIETKVIRDLQDLHFVEWQRVGRKLFIGSITIAGVITQRDLRTKTAEKEPKTARKIK